MLTEYLYLQLLTKCSKLEILSLWNTSIEGQSHSSGDFIEFVGPNIIKGLKELYLSKTSFTEVDRLRNYRVNVTLDNLTTIQINGIIDNYVDQLLIDIGVNCRNLKMADFSGNFKSFMLQNLYFS